MVVNIILGPACHGKEEGLCLSVWEGQRRLSSAGILYLSLERHEEMEENVFSGRR